MADIDREEINKKIHRHISISHLYQNIMNFAVKQCINFKDIANLPSITEDDKNCIKAKSDQFINLLIKNNVLKNN